MRLNPSVSGDPWGRENAKKCDSIHLFLAIHGVEKMQKNATQSICFWRSMGSRKCKKMRLNQSVSGDPWGRENAKKCDSIHLFLAIHGAPETDGLSRIFLHF